MQSLIDGELPKVKCALFCVDSIGQRQENLWTTKQWKEAGYRHRTLYSRNPGAHTIHEIRKLDCKWLDKDRVIQFASFVTETFISASRSSPASTRLRNFADEKGPSRTLSWRGPERRRCSSSETEHRSSRSLTIPKIEL
ncbi:unnamed protein product, partial [Mesorhabditis belari]|uniref:Uncharacterized protein n=1 Tax=Mesorhabditis belari TaxID=2138241 RepID=A0AAF3FNZ6_9BILA